jgi:hypothetical protein
MGIEQSGTTRDTAQVQKDLNMEDRILPRIQQVIDALNLDYKRYYPVEYDRTEVTLIVDNPLAVDHDSDLKETDVKTKQFELYNSLINKGFTPEIASQYVNGELDIESIGEPTNEPVEPITEPTNDDVEADNDLQSGLIQQQEGALKNAIVNIETGLAADVISHVRNKLNKNAFNVVDEIISASRKKDAERELINVLTNFYGIVFNFEGPKTINKRIKETGMMGHFSIGQAVSRDIAKLARKVSESHVETVLSDLLVTTREAALAGDSIDQIMNKIKQKYSDKIVEQRANVIARTETNRAFTRSQYEADRQFISQNRLESRAYKKWVTRSDNPCNFCLALEAEGEKPFSEAFRGLGDSVSDGDKMFDVSFEDLEAGNLHPNCSCIYELVIKSAENFLNEATGQYESMDKRTKEAKNMWEQIQQAQKEMDEKQKKFDEQLKQIDKIIDEL